jgi:hypothetical protein
LISAPDGKARLAAPGEDHYIQPIDFVYFSMSARLVHTSDERPTDRRIIRFESCDAEFNAAARHTAVA